MYPVEDADGNMELVQNLKGHSGCSVQLIRVYDKYLVRKTSGSMEYNARLSRQIDKQIRLREIVPVAEVVRKGIRDGLMSFDMEFVSGRDFEAQCLQEPALWIFHFTERLFQAMNVFANVSNGELSAKSFVEKCGEVSEKVRSHEEFPRVAGMIKPTLDLLKAADWGGIPRTENHGDLTLENILFRNDGSIVFIDMLDGELESVWLDIAKLLFDLEIGWSLRDALWGERNTMHEARLLTMLSRYLHEDISTRVDESFPDLKPRLVQLKVLQAFRIIPYTRDRLTVDRLFGYLREISAQGEITS